MQPYITQERSGGFQLGKEVLTVFQSFHVKVALFDD